MSLWIYTYHFRKLRITGDSHTKYKTYCGAVVPWWDTVAVVTELDDSLICETCALLRFTNASG